MLPLKYAGVSKEEATKRSNDVLDLVGLSSRSKHTLLSFQEANNKELLLQELL